MSFSAIVRAATLGAAAMYFLDPERGRRRRSLVQDKTRSTLQRSERFLERARRDARNRLQGLRVRAARVRASDTWPPAIRLAAIAGGSALALYGLTRSGVRRPVWSAAGLALVARGATNSPVREWTAIARQARAGADGRATGDELQQDGSQGGSQAVASVPPAAQPGL